MEDTTKDQLDSILQKLRSKLQLEVQQRIENQKKMTGHIQNIGDLMQKQFTS